MTAIGQSFASELAASGVLGLPMVWNANGIVTDLDAVDRNGALVISAADKAKVEAVLAAHDPNRLAPVTSVDFLGFMGLFYPAEQAAIIGSGDVQVKIFVAMASGSPIIHLADTRVISGVNYLESQNYIAASRVPEVLSGNAVG